MRRIARSAAIAAATFLVAGIPAAAHASDAPHDAVLAIVKAIRANDVKGFVEHSVTDEQLRDMEADWDVQRKKAPTDAERAEFESTMQTLTANGAEEQLMNEVRPALAEMRPQLPLMIGMVHAMALGAIENSKEYDDEQRAALRGSANALAAWAQESDIASEKLAGDAIGIAARTARGLKLDTLDDVQALNFDQLMGKAAQVLAGVKAVLAVYGLPIDPMLDSARAKTVSRDGDDAVVELSFDFLGTEHKLATKMKREGGRWFSAEQLEALKSGSAEAPAG